MTDHEYEPGDETTPMQTDPRCRICGETERSHDYETRGGGSMTATARQQKEALAVLDTRRLCVCGHPYNEPYHYRVTPGANERWVCSGCGCRNRHLPL